MILVAEYFITKKKGFVHFKKKLFISQPTKKKPEFVLNDYNFRGHTRIEFIKYLTICLNVGQYKKCDKKRNDIKLC